MLEFFIIKKLRKHNSAATNTDSSVAPSGTLTPLLASQDERFLANIIDKPADQEVVILDGERRLQAPEASTEPSTIVAAQNTPTPVQTEAIDDSDWKDVLKAKWGFLEDLGSASISQLEDLKNASKTRLEQIGKGKDQEKGKGKEPKKDSDISEPSSVVSSTAVDTPGLTSTERHEILREDKELTDILGNLDCAPVNGTILSAPSTAIKSLIKNFTQILKDLLNGVPTAYNDLISLFDSSSTLIEKTYNSLPTFLKQLITSLPDKLTPEVIRTLAITSPALANAGTMGLREIVTTPGVVTGLLRSIVEILKVRFPLLLGGGVAMGLGLCVLFFGLWYCYKRGKEEREKREQKEKMETGSDEIVGTDSGTRTSQGKENLQESPKEKEITQQGEKKEQGQAQEKAGPSKSPMRRWWRST